VSSIVIPPARTGRLKTSKTAVIATAHKNNGSMSKVNLEEERAQTIVVIKLIEPKIELTPAK